MVALGVIPNGTKITKDFDGEIFSGRVVSYDKGAKWYRVRYEDGDEEELSVKELWPLQQLDKEIQALGVPPTSNHVAVFYYGDTSWGEYCHLKLNASLTLWLVQIG